MLFTTDQQTLEDLNIFGKSGGNSIYQLYNRTCSRGGALLLREMFSHPLSNEQAINHRSAIIQYFVRMDVDFPIQSNYFDAIEPYLENRDERTKLSAQELSVKAKFTNLISLDANTAAIHKGVTTLADLLKSVHIFVCSLQLEAGHPYEADRDAMAQILADPHFLPIVNQKGTLKLSFPEIAELDVLFRFRRREAIINLLRHLYFLDVYYSVARIAISRGFAIPKALPGNTHELRVTDLYHPQVKNAVPNSIAVTPDSNVVFLTGANMAGKSTFMKSLSISLYLAHMGFPVAASKMEFSVLDGIYTTINLPDNLRMGASHFYAEVLRMKKMAVELKTRKLFILFDELFRGTNVKDAAEATIAITEAFAQKRDSIFVISTHITEAGEILGKKCDNINFIYLPTLMDGNHPVYTYKLAKGITRDRHGMIIINNESILEILEQGLKANSHSGHISGNNQRFIADDQTIADLNLLGKFRPNSIFSLFNQARTAGGERILQEMFENPLTDPVKINGRSAIFSYFHHHKNSFNFDSQQFKQMESYLSMGTSGNAVAAISGLLYSKFSAAFLGDDQFESLQSGLSATVKILNAFREFLGSADDKTWGAYTEERSALLEIYADNRLDWLSSAQHTGVFPFLKIAKYDHLLRNVLREPMERLLKGMYFLDVYLSVSNVARVNDFHYATALPATAYHLSANALRHPGLVNGVSNPVSFRNDQNLMFLTGANMAGKSTFMKAFGIAVYLSHMGFPVAAGDMEFSVLDGIYSSINVADSLDASHSHFYAEVMRVKHVAEEVASGKNLVVLFDELFKGTNVKDAYDGTLSVTTAFAGYRNCCYIISTHIIEVGQALKGEEGHINFTYMPTVVETDGPRYTYLLQKGLTTDRQGMMIIKKEGILDILKERIAE